MEIEYSVSYTSQIDNPTCKCGDFENLIILLYSKQRSKNQCTLIICFPCPHHGDLIESSSKGCKWLCGQRATSSKEHDTGNLFLLSQNYGTDQLPCRLRWVTLQARGRREVGERERERVRVREGERENERKRKRGRERQERENRRVFEPNSSWQTVLHCTRLTMVLTNSSSNL